jgi:hypothetical protein
MMPGNTEEGTTVHNRDERPDMTVDQLSQLVYELLDAHADTICMGDEMAGGLEWEAHLEYLRDLQRFSRGVLANLQPVAIS